MRPTAHPRPFPKSPIAILSTFALLLAVGCTHPPKPASQSEANNVCESPYYQKLDAADPDKLDPTDFAFLARHKRACAEYAKDQDKPPSAAGMAGRAAGRTVLEILMGFFVGLFSL